MAARKMLHITAWSQEETLLKMWKIEKQMRMNKNKNKEKTQNW